MSCPTSYSYINGGCYLLSKNSYNWFDAVKYCNSYNGYLTSISSLAENNWIYEYFKLYGSFTAYIGLNDIAKEGSFTFIDGSNSAFRNWSPSEPNGNGNENCVVMSYASLGSYWIDVPCYFTVKALCKWNQTVSSQTAGNVFFEKILLQIVKKNIYLI